MQRPVVLSLSGLVLAALACGGTGLRDGRPGGGEDVSGQQVFQRLGCPGCHSGESGAVAPALGGLCGTVVTLTTGEEVIADEAYVRESILSPSDKIVSNYGTIMPSYDELISEVELEALVDYVCQLTG